MTTKILLRLFMVILLPLLIVIPVSAATVPYPVQISYVYYDFIPTKDHYNYDIFVNWKEEPFFNDQSSGVYSFFGFWFQNSAVGYMGIQTDKNGKRFLFSIWDEDGITGSAMPTGNCVRFTHEGSGTHCDVVINWLPNREYRLRLWKTVSTKQYAENWSAFVLDTQTGQEQLIGTIELEGNSSRAGYGNLRGDSVTVQEYYGIGSVDCQNLPYAETIWRGPYADNNTNEASRAWATYSSICENSNVTSSGRPFVAHKTGGLTKRTTPKDSDVWAKRFYLPFIKQ